MDMALALAVIHHLAISNNVPLPQWWQISLPHAVRGVIEFVQNQIRRFKIINLS
ncbi:MAG: hypothetical protein IPN96_18565 [Anaerolineales bacterium]|nr:hypothetical protein [Anaerolineales bacterium]